MKLINNPKDFIQVVLILLFLLSPLILIINSNYYIDPFRFSAIKLEKDIIRGDKKTIRLAIKDLRSRDPASYRRLLKYIDRIGEKHCYVADHVTHHSEYQAGFELPGCYIRGSKTIYLIPNKSTSAQTVRERSLTLAKLTVFAEEFWKNY